MTREIMDFTTGDSEAKLETVFQRDVFHPTMERFSQEDPGSIYGDAPLAPVSEISRLLRAAISIAGANEKKTLSLIDDVCEYKFEKDAETIEETVTEMKSESLSDVKHQFNDALSDLNEHRQQCREELRDVGKAREQLLTGKIPNDVKNTYQLLSEGDFEVARITLVDYEFRDTKYYLDDDIEGEIGAEGIELFITDMGGEIVDDPVAADYAIWDYESKSEAEKEWKPIISHVVDIPYKDIRDEIADVPENSGETIGTGNLRDSYVRRFNLETPITVLGVIDTSKVGENDDKYKRVLPQLPWYGVLTCTCESKIDDETRRELPICEHEMFVLLKHVTDDLVENDIGELPQRFKRVVHKHDYRTVMENVIN